VHLYARLISLAAVADEFAKEGMELISSAAHLKHLMPMPGVLSRRQPTKAELADIDFGWKAAKAVAGFDIGIMPLSPDPFSKGKSAYKLLQYMAVGVPSVCSAVGMNIEVSDGDRLCLAASTHDGFAKKTLDLLSNEDMRRQMGQSARVAVRNTYSIRKVGEQLAGHIVSLVNR